MLLARKDIFILLDEQIYFAINGAHNIFLDQLMTLLTGKMVWVPHYISLLYVVW